MQAASDRRLQVVVAGASAQPSWQRQQDVHHLADQVVAHHALELVGADSVVVRSSLVRSRDDGADVAVAELAGHGAVVEQKIAHHPASLFRVGEGVSDGERPQQLIEDVRLLPREVTVLQHEDGLHVVAV